MKTKFIVFALLAFVLFNCSDDDEDKDIRDQAVGTYNYKTKSYYIENGQLVYTGSEYDVTGTVIVSKTSSGFEVKEGGDVLYAGEKVAEASNGFTFDVKTQTVNDPDLGSITFEGYDGYSLNSVKYNGAYITNDKKLTGYVQWEYDGVIFVFEIVATKV
jgi:hypothetical protein